jgi:hypothetical protein
VRPQKFVSGSPNTPCPANLKICPAVAASLRAEASASARPHQPGSREGPRASMISTARHTRDEREARGLGMSAPGGRTRSGRRPWSCEARRRPAGRLRRRAVRWPPRQPSPRCERRRARHRAPGQARRGDAVHRRGAESARGGPAAHSLRGVPRPSPAGRADRCVTDTRARAKISRRPWTRPAQTNGA